MPIISGPCETTREKANACNKEPGLGARDGLLEVLSEPTIASEPSEGAFDDPALGLGLELSDPFGSGDYLDRPPAKLGNRVAQPVTAINTIGKDVLQFGKFCSQAGEQRHRAVIVLDIGRVHQQREQKTLRIGQYVALAPFDPLRSIKSAWTAAFRGLGTLTIDNAGRGNSRASYSQAGAPDQRA